MDSIRSTAMDRNHFEFGPGVAGGVKKKMALHLVKPIAPCARRKLTRAEVRTMVAWAFGNLREGNPLKQMAEADQAIVWGTLLIFTSDRGSPSQYLRQIDHLAQIANDAAKLAIRVKETLRHDYGEPLNRRLSACQDLPARLDVFAKEAGELMRPWGKTRLKRKRALEDRYLVYASEFVKLKTGSWNDEHLAELLQTTRSKPIKFWGDAVRKTRERFKIKHPLLYRTILENISEGRYC